MAKVRQYSEQTDRDLSAIIAHDRQRRTFGLGDVSDDELFGEKQIRWAKTTTSTAHPTYPTAPARKFVVEFGDYSFTDTTITDEAATFTAYAPEHKRVAYSPAGFLTSGSIVRVTLNHGRWYVVTEPWMYERKAVITESGGITAGSFGEVTIYINGASTSWTVDAYLNWMHGGTDADQDMECVIRWFPDESKWVIVELECPPP